MQSQQRLFVIGGGGREHALVWHLARAFPEASLYCAPGNPGISRLATCLPIAPLDVDGLVGAAASLEIDHTVVGPEGPLVGGVVDAFRSRGLSIMGPTALAARIEGSKVFAKDLMRRYGIPTAEACSFDDPTAALAHIRGRSGGFVVKADGLAAGKGVIVCDDVDATAAAVHMMMVDRAFGTAGERIVIEDRLEGPEVSAFALVNGASVRLLPSAQDHKRALDGDRGVNTGGMGAVAPYPVAEALRERIRRVFERAAHALCAEGCPYDGVLFAGLMLTRDGPCVLEFNCRLGDPEAQVLLPLLDDAGWSLIDAFTSVRAGDPYGDRVAQPQGAAAAVVLAAHGYPQAPRTGDPIAGLESAERDELVFHSGTVERGGRLLTAGGRVLTVVGRGSSIAEALAHTYRAAGVITFDGMQFRTDIGAQIEDVGREDPVGARAVSRE